MKTVFSPERQSLARALSLCRRSPVGTRARCSDLPLCPGKPGSGRPGPGLGTACPTRTPVSAQGGASLSEQALKSRSDGSPHTQEERGGDRAPLTDVMMASERGEGPTWRQTARQEGTASARFPGPTLRGLVRKSARCLLGCGLSSRSIAKDSPQGPVNKRRLPCRAGVLDTGELSTTDKRTLSYQNLL